MLRKRYYILFVARDEDGGSGPTLLPLKYGGMDSWRRQSWARLAIVGLAGIVHADGCLKTESYNQVRADRETLRQNFHRMAAIAHNRSVQVVASQGALANEKCRLSTG